MLKLRGGENMLVFSVFMILLLLFILKYNNRRSFILLLFSTIGCFIFIVAIFYQFLNIIANYSTKTEWITLIIFYIFVPLCLAIIGLFFIKNTSIMSSREGHSVVSKLSAMLGVNILLVVPASFLFFVVGIDTHWGFFLDIFVSTVLLSDIMSTIYFVLYLMYSVFYQMVPVSKKIDYIIVLGAGIIDENVTPLLKSRLDKAIEYYLNNKDCKIVVSGGQGENEPVSEAYAMRKYLLSQNIPLKDILYEDKSTNTYENMLYSKSLIEQDSHCTTSSSNIYFTTNNYHVLRGAIYAKKVKLHAGGIGAPTASYFLPSALIREYIALPVVLVDFRNALTSISKSLRSVLVP
ncbi:YdcF family protein, partial [Enterococcus faecalis]|uniref:YdcF family protein n=1 Tax=Enterococcus faecalis TaxID=1351 RepID=UPI003D12AF7B